MSEAIDVQIEIVPISGRQESLSGSEMRVEYTYENGELIPPVLWEMMYEGNLVDAPEWQKIWGLRVPIAHWVNKNRAKEIRRQKTFSAIHKDLKFAGTEIELAKKLAPGLAHKNLIEVCRERVDQELLETQDSRWLYNYLNRPPDNNNNCQWEADQWKLKTLVSIYI